MGILPMNHGLEARATSSHLLRIVGWDSTPSGICQGGGMGILPMNHGLEARATSSHLLRIVGWDSTPSYKLDTFTLRRWPPRERPRHRR